MECNKEEAKRAKEIAEEMMLCEDFVGAHRIIQKAQCLDPDIKDISKMLAVCNVQCTSNVKINGEVDWYGILQVDQTADDITITKQCRKLVLLLHPDKNKYPGAESAFKIVREAEKTLLDKSQRLIHDMKTKSRQQNVPGPTTSQQHFQRNTESGKKQTKNCSDRASTNEETFWTACTCCKKKFQHCCNSMHNPFRCPHCMTINVPSNGAGQRSYFEAKRCSRPNEKSEASKGDYSSEMPASEFYDLFYEKVYTYCSVGEIWAFYCDADETPKCYGQIRKVESNRHKKHVHVTWLEGYPEFKREEIWYKGKLPSGCGAFKLSTRSTIFHSKRMFSHIMHHAVAIENGHYVVYPYAGEVWALYKNWSCNWSLSDLQNCEYDIVEVDCNRGDGIRVSVLSKVNGHACLFSRVGDLGNVIDVPALDSLRFSHRIPAFKLPKEMARNRRVYWKLDPAAVPEIVLMEG